MRCNIFTCYCVALSKYILSNFSCKMHEQRLQNTFMHAEWASHGTILLKEAHKPSSTCCNCHRAAPHWGQPRKSCVKDTCQQKQCTMQRVLFPRAMSLGLGICAPKETLTWGCLGLLGADKRQNPRGLVNDSQLTSNTAGVVAVTLVQVYIEKTHTNSPISLGDTPNSLYSTLNSTM